MVALISERGGKLLLLIAAFFSALAIFIWMFSYLSGIYISIGIFDLNLRLIYGLAFFSSAAIGTSGAIILSAARLNLYSDAGIPASQTNDLADLRRQVTDLTAKVTRLAMMANGKKELEALAERVFKQRIIDRVKEISVDEISSIAKDEILLNYKPSIFREKAFKDIKVTIDQYATGMHDQISRQAKAAGQNLLWGIIFAAFGLLIMGTFLFGSILFGQSVPNIAEAPNWGVFIQTFVPKFTFVVLFETIAFFFLRAYSDDRNMVRYLRNEATNIESRNVALLASIYFGDTPIQSAAFASLMATERNLMKKGDKLMIESLAKEHPLLFEEIARKLIPSFSRSGAN